MSGGGMSGCGCGPVIAGGGGGGSVAFTTGHAWERPDPVVAGGGAQFLDSDSLVAYTSSGQTTPGWGVQLGLATFGNDRAGLRLNTTGVIYESAIDLSAYTIGATTLALLFSWTGPIATFATLTIAGDTAAAGVNGISVYLKKNGADIDLVVFTGAGGLSTTLKTFAPAATLTAGLHAVCLAPVSVTGTHYWRWSFDGSVTVDTAMTANYVAPTTSASVTMCSRIDALFPLPGTAHDLILWGSLLSNADIAAEATLPLVPTYRLPESASTGAGNIRVEANRYDLQIPLILLSRGVPLPMTIGSAVRKIQY